MKTNRTNTTVVATTAPVTGGRRPVLHSGVFDFIM